MPLWCIANGASPTETNAEMNEYEFEQATGRKPIEDDMERVNCEQMGEIGHLSCGWCAVHDQPMFECGCGIRLANRFSAEQ